MARRKTLLVIGRSGQLAQALARSPPFGFDVVFAGRGRFDLGLDDPSALLDSLGPTAVINAAAYNAVDGAESDPATAFRVNGHGPGALAAASWARGAPLVHVSTDYVFDGCKQAPYTEADAAHPLGVYGESKLAGERAVLESEANAAVVRTSWVFGSSGTNFLAQVLGLVDGPDEARIVADQKARPTWAHDLAVGLGKLVTLLLDREPGARGLFHLAGADDAGRVEMAELIFDWARARGHRAPRICRVSTAAFGAPARRPLDTRLDCARIAELGIAAHPWRERLSLCLEERAP